MTIDQEKPTVNVEDVYAIASVIDGFRQQVDTARYALTMGNVEQLRALLRRLMVETHSLSARLAPYSLPAPVDARPWEVEGLASLDARLVGRAPDPRRVDQFRGYRMELLRRGEPIVLWSADVAEVLPGAVLELAPRVYFAENSDSDGLGLIPPPVLRSAVQLAMADETRYLEVLNRVRITSPRTASALDQTVRTVLAFRADEERERERERAAAADAASDGASALPAAVGDATLALSGSEQRSDPA